ncbi:MAG TPA: type II toxin-antitoxin system RelE/ParE family toxin [Pyrinomonadaceae bacterium]|nr:type II toxin-antitoxin system RelE/ParE family toxin [Pyrinomonadaceae bacterium]
MKVNWTEAARAQLRDIRGFVAGSSPQYATKMVDRLTRRSQQIATFPRSGRIVPEASDVNIREVLEGPYRIIYHILEDEIDIIAVVHGARQWPEEP